MAGSLAGKVALVTGASSGIGQAAALSLAQAGASVALSARRVDRLGALVDRIHGAGGKAIALPGDVAVEAEATRAVTDTLAQFGRIDILVNSAGVIQSGGVESLSLDEWRRVIGINLLGTLYTCKAAIGPMKAQGSGDIINISSTAGRRAAGLFGPYSTSKFGLTGLTESLRQEVGGAGIRVAIVEPGATATEVADGISDPAMRAAMTDHVGKDSAMQPDDIAQAILFITSLPARANVSQILIRPTADKAAM